MKTRLLCAAAFVAAACALLAAQPGAPGSLLVLSKGDLTLAVVDPVTLKVLGRAPSGPDPHEVVASPDGRTAYIANYNGGRNIISVVDLTAMKPLPAIDLGALRAPHGLAFAAGKLWFTAEAAKVVGSYDPQTQKIDLVIGTGQNGTHMIYVTDDASRLVTTNIASATVSIIDRAGAGRGGQPNWDAAVVPVGRGAEGFDVSPDRKEIWVANAQDGTISIVDAVARKPAQTLDANVRGANRLKFTPDGKLVLVSSLTSPDLAIFDVAARREAKRVRIGTGAAGIEIQPDGARAYVACTPDNYVAILDLKKLDVAGHIDAGRQPDGLAWTKR